MAETERADGPLTKRAIKDATVSADVSLVSERAEKRGWFARAHEAIAFARTLPDDEAEWTPAQRARHDQLLAGVHEAVARHDAAVAAAPTS